MKIFNVNNLRGGWFVGSFNETAYHTIACEIAYKNHYAGELWDAHYHAIADEINYLISGEMEINGQKLIAPIIFVISKNEIAKPIFITDVSLIVVKIPGVLNDKIIVN